MEGVNRCFLQELVPTAAVNDLQGDLQIQEWMRELRRVKRAPTRNVQPIVVVLPGFDMARASPYYQDLLYPEPLRRRRAKRARYCPILGRLPSSAVARVDGREQQKHDLASCTGMWVVFYRDNGFDDVHAKLRSAGNISRRVSQW
ncbi:unnamed protein product [Heligmosomoides polygyrus]|uniref:Uncharacterized protein n=1 Tax=Heligmosomoides polygyrus TaxID=6339 RepID=A0A3P8C869_HELPZ|nr:unnamed protein product [Heligmosomoides polygyrus]